MERLIVYALFLDFAAISIAAGVKRSTPFLSKAIRTMWGEENIPPSFCRIDF